LLHYFQCILCRINEMRSGKKTGQFFLASSRLGSDEVHKRIGNVGPILADWNLSVPNTDEMGFKSIVEYDVACLCAKAAKVAGSLITAFEDKRCIGTCVNVMVELACLNFLQLAHRRVPVTSRDKADTSSGAGLFRGR
jgi:hypothetical protein